VLFLGGSAVQAVTSSEARVEAMLGDEVGRPIEVVNVTMLAQSLWEMLAIAERLPRFDGVVVVGVSLSMMLRQEKDLRARFEQPRLGFVSEELDAEGRRIGVEPPWRSGIYLWDNRSYLLERVPNVFRSLFRGPAHQSVDRYLDKPVQGPQEWEMGVQDLKSLLKQGREDPLIETRNRDLLLRLVEHFQARGRVEVVLLQSPVNPDLLDEVGPSVFPVRRNALGAMARQHGSHYWYLDEEAGLIPEDFVDLYHVRTRAAQERYLKTLCQHLGELLR